LRLAETYQATTDAVSRVMARALSKRAPRSRDPWYLRPDSETAVQGLTPETGLDEAIFRFASRTGRTPTALEDGTVRFANEGRRVH
jgi:hypothetical protein